MLNLFPALYFCAYWIIDKFIQLNPTVSYIDAKYETFPI
jgi:hypothetical protein